MVEVHPDVTTLVDGAWKVKCDWGVFHSFVCRSQPQSGPEETPRCLQQRMMQLMRKRILMRERRLQATTQATRSVVRHLDVNHGWLVDLLAPLVGQVCRVWLLAGWWDACVWSAMLWPPWLTWHCTPLTPGVPCCDLHGWHDTAHYSLLECHAVTSMVDMTLHTTHSWSAMLCPPWLTWHGTPLTSGVPCYDLHGWHDTAHHSLLECHAVTSMVDVALCTTNQSNSSEVTLLLKWKQ